MSDLSDMTMDEVVKKLRQQLVPQGKEPYVCLKPMDTTGMWYHKDFIEQLIREVATLPMMTALGESPSALQKLGLALLCDSAYITNKSGTMK